VKEFIKLQHGEISVKSVEGEGSTFSFYIPYEDGTIAIKHTHEGQSTEELLSLFNGQHILGVDDNELNLKFLEMMTRKWNIKFYGATNGREALELIRKENIDVVFTDIQMPEMDGDQLLAAIRKLDPPLSQLPVIMMSGEVQMSGKLSFSERGFNGVVSKPFVEAELVEQIVAVLKL
jgi:CheY-like chemotaxis protein